MKFDNPHMQLYIASMGKIFRVQHIAETDDEANEIMRKDKNLSVMACDPRGRVYLCEQYGAVCPSSVLKDMKDADNGSLYSSIKALQQIKEMTNGTIVGTSAQSLCDKIFDIADNALTDSI